MCRLILTLAFVLTCGPVSAAEHWSAEDGDTLWHDKKRIQLLGFDAPELSQACFDAADKIWPCGKYARDHIQHLIASGDVSCIVEGKDGYNDDIGVRHSMPCGGARRPLCQTQLVGRELCRTAIVATETYSGGDAREAPHGGGPFC